MVPLSKIFIPKCEKNWNNILLFDIVPIFCFYDSCLSSFFFLYTAAIPMPDAITPKIHFPVEVWSPVDGLSFPVWLSGILVGDRVGERDGTFVGDGVRLGVFVGVLVGVSVGVLVGSLVGSLVGVGVGVLVGSSVGVGVGDGVGVSAVSFSARI